jgi:DNA-binding NarL/FixJ family response regulator
MPKVTTKILQNKYAGLTDREADILLALSGGQSNADIATSLGITERTVKNTMNAICLRMGFSPEDRGGSLRVRMALHVHGII